MAPLTIKAKLSENRRDVHSDQRPVEPDGGRPACRGCLMGLRRFKVFYCTIRAILWSHYCCYDYRMVSSILIDMMRSCRGIFKRPMLLCIHK